MILKTIGIKPLYFISALKAKDVKKQRQRNLVPAKVGVYATIIFVVYMIIYGALFGLQVHELDI